MVMDNRTSWVARISNTHIITDNTYGTENSSDSANTLRTYYWYVYVLTVRNLLLLVLFCLFVVARCKRSTRATTKPATESRGPSLVIRLVRPRHDTAQLLLKLTDENADSPPSVLCWTARPRRGSYATKNKILIYLPYGIHHGCFLIPGRIYLPNLCGGVRSILANVSFILLDRNWKLILIIYSF